MIKLVKERLNESTSFEKREEIISKLEEIELFVYDNPQPAPLAIRKMCEDLVNICLK